MKSRLYLLNLLFFIFSAVIVLRLFSLQVLSHAYYQTLAENQHQLFATLVPERGEVFVSDPRDISGLLNVVTNIEKDLVYAVPPEIFDKAAIARALAPILEMTQSEIFEKLSDDSRKWVAIKKELPESVSLILAELDLPGIYLQPETLRFYPEKDFAAQVLGFVSYHENERKGTYGIEEAYEEVLSGIPGSLAQIRDAAGRWITGGEREVKPATDGADLVLTLDRAIQLKAQEVVKRTVETHLADQGTIVVLEPATGKVLAMAGYPDFDPNEFAAAEDPAVFRNLAVSEAYEPGSVMKPVTMAAGLDSGAVTPDMTFVDEGFVALDDFVIRNATGKTFGEQTMTQVLEQSINTGAIFVQQQTGKEKFRETLEKFGFGEVTGIELPAESRGDTRNLIYGGDVHYATAAFGQGITVTPLQLVSAFGTIANGGKRIKPHIVEEIRYRDGETKQTISEDMGQVISQKSANTLAAMMVQVVEEGHGKRAGVPGYYIAGKTGTAQVAATDRPGYDEERTIGSFAGFGPVADPRFAIVVKISNPKTVRFAESTAAPAFGEMAQFLVNYFQIPPTR